MEKIVLKAKRRPTGKTAKAIRREGLLPAVMYGRHYPSTAIVLPAHESSLVLPFLSSSAIVTIDLDGVAVRTLDVEGLLKTKQSLRDKDRLDRIILERALEESRRRD